MCITLVQEYTLGISYLFCCMLCPFDQEPGGTWLPLHSEVVMENGQILCTRNPTGHRVLIDYRFELPCGKPSAIWLCFNVDFLLLNEYE